MSPPRSGATRYEPGANGRRRRARRRARSARRRRLAIVAIVLLVLAVGVSAATVGGAAAVGTNCDLSSLRPVSIGENSFVYAADNSLLGTIPAERNRSPSRSRR